MAKRQQVREIELNWPPHTDGSTPGPSERQSEFLRCGAKEQLYGGSKRGGKTVAGCAKAIALSYFFPGNRGYIFRNAFTDLRDSTLVTFSQLVPSWYILDHNKVEHRFSIRSIQDGVPSTILYSGMGEDSEVTVRAKEKSKAKESGWFWVDEPSEVSFDAYRMMLAQLCWFLPDKTRPPYMAFLTSNPEPGWAMDRFVDAESDAYIIGKADAKFIPSLPRENPGLPENWESDLRATMPPSWCDRYLDGSWEIHEGMAFPELSERVHDLDRYVPASDMRAFLQGYRVIGSLDHATTGTTAYELMAVDESRFGFAFAEHYQPNKLITEHAASIKALESTWGFTPQYRLIDPSTQAKTLQGGTRGPTAMYSVQYAYQIEGISTQAAYRTDIQVGLDLINQWLHVDPNLIHPFTQERGSPRLFISRRGCPNLWREMTRMKMLPDANGQLQPVGTDHGIDNLRYMLMSRPNAAEAKAPALPAGGVNRLAAVSHNRWAERWDKQTQGGNQWL